VSKIKKINVIANCNYGLTFPAVIAQGNLIGVQFHPEKSQHNGDILLQNFVELIT
jgi:glutamine amidotransferase